MGEMRKKLFRCSSHMVVIALFLAAGLNGSIHLASGASILSGKWSGQTKDAAGDPIPVELVINDEEGRISGKLDYGPDRNCTSDAVWAISQDKVHTFRFSKADGGWCRKLTDGVMELTEIDNAMLSMRVRNSRKGVDEITMLKKQ